MNADQEFTPKYWIGHNKSDDDVIIKSATKSFEDTLKKMNILEPNWIDRGFEINLFEIKLCMLN